MRGITDSGIDRFRDHMRGLVEGGAMPGLVWLLARGDHVHTGAYGVSTIDTGEPMREDAIFRIASMTKPILAAATMQLVERGALSLEDPVETWLPELADRKVLRTPQSELDDVVPAKRPITVDDLLTCRSGHGWVFADGESPIARAMAERGAVSGKGQFISSNEWLARFIDLPLIHQPGEDWYYHTSFEILGILLSRVTGTTLGEHLRAAIFEPLGMVDTSLFVPAGKRHRLPTLYQRDQASGGLYEQRAAITGYHSQEPSFDVSHGELASTVGDYHRFAAMLMKDGELDSARILTPESVSTMVRDHIGPELTLPDGFFPASWGKDGWGYGVGVKTVRGAFGEPGQYYWMGGYGTGWMNDPHIGLIAIVMSQVDLDDTMLATIDAFFRTAYGTLA